MKHSLAAVFAAAISTTAVAQDQPSAPETASPWGFFEGAGGMAAAAVEAADGSQLIVKCDKPGRREVYAMILSADKKLAAPNSRPISRPIRFQFDAKSPSTEDWRFYEKYATALGKTGERALARFIVDLRNATKLRILLDTGMSSDVDLTFDVTGAKAAVSRIYESCNDSQPA